jgi:hypothetical protein
MDELIAFNWVTIDSFERNVLKVKDKFCQITGEPVDEVDDFPAISEDGRANAREVLCLVIEAKSKKDNALICGSSPREIRDASRVLSGLVFLSKSLREIHYRTQIYSPVNPNFDVIFLADAEAFYQYQLSLEVPNV